jgi:hypothetical protein
MEGYSINSILLTWRGDRARRWDAPEESAREIASQENGIVDLLSGTLTREYGRGFSRRNLFNIDPGGGHL